MRTAPQLPKVVFNILILVSTSFLVSTSKALVTRSDALVPSSFLLHP